MIGTTRPTGTLGPTRPTGTIVTGCLTEGTSRGLGTTGTRYEELFPGVLMSDQ